ncbi:hypothetical protein VTH06DRAFT_6604 [Thermothelomyces fergusii]
MDSASNQTTALVRKRTDTELMPPPPPAKRIHRPKRVLDEETYTEALSHIIARDFFPGLLESEIQQEYLDALESKDEEWIESASRRLRQVMAPGRQRRLRSTLATPLRPAPAAAGRTPVSYVGETPASAASAARGGPSSSSAATCTTTTTTTTTTKPPIDLNVSLATFQSRYTSEDNESFYRLLDRQNQKRVQKYAWLWTGNKLPSKQQLKQKEVEARLLARRGPGALRDDGFARDRLAIADADSASARPAVPDHWKGAKPRNELMFVPDGVEEAGWRGRRLQTVAERAQAESRAPPKQIVYENTRPPRPGGPAIAGNRRPCDAESSVAGVGGGGGGGGGETPRVNGYAFVDDEEPEPEPGSERGRDRQRPLIELSAGDTTPNPFKLQEWRKRELLHHRMVDRISQSKRTSARLGFTGSVDRAPVPKFPSSPRVSGGLTPAAQRLWGKIGGAGRKNAESPFGNSVSFTPKATPRAKGSGLKSVAK